MAQRSPNSRDPVVFRRDLNQNQDGDRDSKFSEALSNAANLTTKAFNNLITPNKQAPSAQGTYTSNNASNDDKKRAKRPGSL